MTRVAVVLVVVTLAVAVGGTAAAPTQAPTLRELVGRRLVVSFQGTSPSAALLTRIRRGEVGGVIIFSAVLIAVYVWRHKRKSARAE